MGNEELKKNHQPPPPPPTHKKNHNDAHCSDRVLDDPHTWESTEDEKVFKAKTKQNKQKHP